MEDAQHNKAAKVALGYNDWHYQVCVNLRQLICTQCQVQLQFYVTRVQVSRHFITLRSHCLAGNRGRQAGGSIYTYNNYMNHGQPCSTWMDLLTTSEICHDKTKSWLTEYTVSCIRTSVCWNFYQVTEFNTGGVRLIYVYMYQSYRALLTQVQQHSIPR